MTDRPLNLYIATDIRLRDSLSFDALFPTETAMTKPAIDLDKALDAYEQRRTEDTEINNLMRQRALTGDSMAMVAICLTRINDTIGLTVDGGICGELAEIDKSLMQVNRNLESLIEIIQKRGR